MSITVQSLIDEYKADWKLLDDLIKEIESKGGSDPQKVDQRKWIASAITDLESVITVK